MIINHEKIKREYNTIQTKLEINKYASYTWLIVPGDKYINAAGKMAKLPGIVYTDKDYIHKLSIKRNINRFSLVERIPQEIRGFIFEALELYGTNTFYDKVLEGKMTQRRIGWVLI